MKKFLFPLFLLFMVSPTALWAQAKIEFKETQKDFGQIVEGVKASYEFTFTNTGTSPLLLSNVSASCGCTTPEWPRKPIAPGKSAVIKAIYNSQGRPGRFYKTVTVTTNGQPQQTRLVLKGEVLKPDQVKEVTFTAAELAQSPSFKTTRTTLVLGKVEVAQPVVVRIPVTNEGPTPLQVKALTSNCRCVRVDPGMLPMEVASGKTMELTFFYTPSRAGNIADEVLLITNDLRQQRVKLNLQAESVEQMSNQSLLKQGGSIGGGGDF